MKINYQSRVATLSLWPRVTAVVTGENTKLSNMFKHMLESIGIETKYTKNCGRNITISLVQHSCDGNFIRADDIDEKKFIYLKSQDTERKPSELYNHLLNWMTVNLLSSRKFFRTAKLQQHVPDGLTPKLSEFNKVDAKKLTKTFRVMMSQDVILLKNHIKENEFTKTLRLIHKIKGSSSIAESTLITQYCKEVEDFSKVDHNENSTFIMTIILIETIQDMLEVIDRS
ncbi:Hpt domain-containing protein [Shewanella sp. Isolate11]|uniref:Hpt domain-containing protein n=1 Tax=Shewanella sp. Isolate11 TaxID=2908530 RepID=UPI001EFE53AC|nr:Hpt domain-containing protein [Shewanella sp. Isolate11]MCG9696097.1 Hpt domain-containing protein [Shewanella sp. Isolate11]